MIHQALRAFAFGAVVCAAAGIANSQSNVIPGTEVSLGGMSSLSGLGHIGVFPNGTEGLAMLTTSCNLGTVNVPWLQAMQENHPFIAFLIAREKDGRFSQISDRSYVKHGFFALSDSQCTPCQNPSNGTFLGVGCSDTYAVSNNGDNFWLGPPDEINPWLGTWTAQCSHFDKGEPVVAPAQQCDGFRSLSAGQALALGNVGHRIRVPDAELNNQPGALFWYQGQYVIRGEPEANRENNLGSRRFTATWNGVNNWNISTTTAQLNGSILKRWTGATITSNTNGGDDGRIYVGVRVTGPVNGLFHYEYAVHNRDNHRGVSTFEIPVPECAQIQNVGFRDIDADGTNQWSADQVNGTFTFSTSTNPLKWNSIFNFWFDSPAGPAAGDVTMLQAAAGPGASTMTVSTTVPTSVGYASYGTGTPGCAGEQRLCANSPPTINNPTFAFTGDNAPPSSLGLGMLGDVAIPGGADVFGFGFTLLVDLIASTQVFTLNLNSDANGNATGPAPLPNDPGLVGITINGQGLWVWTDLQCAPAPLPSPLGISTTNGIALTFLP